MANYKLDDFIFETTESVIALVRPLFDKELSKEESFVFLDEVFRESEIVFKKEFKAPTTDSEDFSNYKAIIFKLKKRAWFSISFEDHQESETHIMCREIHKENINNQIEHITERFQQEMNYEEGAKTHSKGSKWVS